MESGRSLIRRRDVDSFRDSPVARNPAMVEATRRECPAAVNGGRAAPTPRVTGGARGGRRGAPGEYEIPQPSPGGGAEFSPRGLSQCWRLTVARAGIRGGRRRHRRHHDNRVVMSGVRDKVDGGANLACRGARRWLSRHSARRLRSRLRVQHLHDQDPMPTAGLGAGVIVRGR